MITALLIKALKETIVITQNYVQYLLKNIMKKEVNSRG